MSSLLDSTTKSKAKKKILLLNQLHIYCILGAQILAASILLAIAIWSFIRMPDPEVHLTRLTIDSLDNNTNANITNNNLLRYSITLHNPDRYKSIKYDILVLRVTFSVYSSEAGYLINYNRGNNSFIQGPGETTLLADHVLSCTDVGWDPNYLYTLKTRKTNIYFRLIMEVNLITLNKVIRSRQFMRTLRAYFDDDGKALIFPPHTGLIFD